MLRVSYLQRGTVRCSFIGLKSTICLNPPVLLGSNLEAETQGVGCWTGTTAPSTSSFGRSVCLQNASSSSDQTGLWLWNYGGGELNGKVTPVFIHFKINFEAPVLAQNGKLFRTLRCIPVYGKTFSCFPVDSGCHLP
jgi:hypothetical protein